jgi:hypothetical protein
MRSHGSSVGIATTQRDGRQKNRNLIAGTGNRDLSLFNNVQTSCEAHPASYAMVTAGLKQQNCEHDNLSPLSAEIKNDGATDPLPHPSSWHHG